MADSTLKQPLLLGRDNDTGQSRSSNGNGKNLKCGDVCPWAEGHSVERSQDVKKLSRAVIFCVLFMIIEVVGGIKAGSLAILTDASHLLSDVASFAISLFAIWAGGWEANLRQTFGFYRLEILGALVSIQIIWLLTGIIVYEAFERLFQDTVEVDGRLMFIIASLGLVVNLAMMLLLDHGHGHGHDHGHGHAHDHAHDHGPSHQAGNELSHDHNHGDPRHRNTHGHQHDEHDHNHSNEHKQDSDLHGHDHEHGDKHHDHGDHPGEEHILHSDHEYSHEDPGLEKIDGGPVSRQTAAVALQQKGHKTECVRENITKSRRSTTGDTIIVCICDEIDGQSSQNSGLAERSVRVTIDHEGHEGDLGEAKSINVQGAYLHVLGDLIQSIGVMIGGAVIWYNPKLKIVDLICTFFFSLVVLGTTIKLLRDILEVLMESTPRQVDAGALKKGLEEIEGVIAVHELHIWAITVGKVLLACHVRIEPDANSDDVLQEVIHYCDKKYKISHVTIQIERYRQ